MFVSNDVFLIFEAAFFVGTGVSTDAIGRIT